MVEVLISSLLVALIVFATFNGFDVLNRASADQRQRDQATVLASASQDQLRTSPASALQTLQITPHSYTQTVGGTVFTIKQTAKYINESKPSSECSATTANESSSKENSDYLQVTSTVTWPAQTKVGRPPIVQSAVITPPTGSGLEADVLNGQSPEEGVNGVTAIAKYVAAGQTGETTVENTTNASGCALFGAIPATAAKLEVKPPANYVTRAGLVKIPVEEVTIAPNITTHKTYTIAEGGAIKGEFTYNGSATYEGKPVQSEGFVAFNTGMLTSPNYIAAATAYSFEGSGEERYTPATGTMSTVATTPQHGLYSKGDLFPFPSSTGKWVVYGGDCTANTIPAAGTPAKNQEVAVSPGATATVQVPLAKVTLNVWKGTKESEGLSTETLPVRIFNNECKAAVPNNAAAGVYVHKQVLSSGHLTYPFQPFGSYSLCVYREQTKKNYTVTYKTETQAGPTKAIYLGSGTTAEQTVVEKPAEPCT